ncbi:ectoine/hydroxyectoine ABC transporter substrate-binding protein EhuB [Pseudonocardia kunmingensis]|uniref:Polar amino acid transport system substrate-binding protein n=1 Tax=Pseudonocardia kunmingensis TaxID=630975 RepID=A0A543CY92_9PSEU|nr:ectoine/hydroxyectoine ABC transporter substrate-binding protein EhuB [Pseudonocardia kunmingensis]TQM02073.1 polar amino acid transport system substrate-binding protein [Pseudonocardia kunmingensis]
MTGHGATGRGATGRGPTGRHSWSRRGFLRLGAALGAGALSGGCASAASAGSYAVGGSTLARAREAGVISIGIANEAPYGYTGPDGTVTGEAVEVARAVFTDLGVPAVRPVTVDFGELIPGLTLARQFDVVTAGMFVTAQRCEAVAFSVPDYTAPTAFLVPRGNPRGVATFDQVREQDLRVAVLGGAVEYRYALDSGVSEARVLPLADQQALLLAVEAGRADCAALTNISLNNVVAANPDTAVEVTPGFFPVIGGREVVSAGAFALRPGEDDLLEAMNARLRAMQQSGEWLRIAQPFGFGPDNVPGEDVTTEGLCAG